MKNRYFLQSIISKPISFWNILLCSYYTDPEFLYIYVCVCVCVCACVRVRVCVHILVLMRGKGNVANMQHTSLYRGLKCR